MHRMPLAPPAARAARRRTLLKPTTLLSFQVQKQRGWVVAAAFGVLLAACGSGDASTTDTLEQVDTTVGDVASDPEVETVVVDGELTDDGITTSAVADEAAERSDVAPTKDVITRSPDAVGDGSPPQNVGTAIVRITDADGNTCEVCMWLADEAAERSTGLMGVFDLGQPIGMAFTWDAPTSGNFFMLNTPTPLSIAWFASDGSYASEADMEPCITDDSSTCERYGAGGDYMLAIEMFQGELGKVGIGPGSRAEIVKLPEAGAETICPLIG